LILPQIGHYPLNTVATVGCDKLQIPSVYLVPLSDDFTQEYASLAVNSDALPTNIAVAFMPPAENLKGNARSDFFASNLGMMID
jgi:hypothetical protein